VIDLHLERRLRAPFSFMTGAQKLFELEIKR